MRNIVLLAYPGASVMALAAVSAFETANLLDERPLYALRFLSETGGSVSTSVGMALNTDPIDGAGGDTLLVGGGVFPDPASDALLNYVRAAPDRFRRVASICTGAFLLAQAGLLDGRRATTHWLDAARLQSRFPNVRVEADRIFVQDGGVWTSAGMSAGVDLALQLIEDDQGRDRAKAVARKLVLYHRRGGGQSQFSSLIEMSPTSDRIRASLAFARENLRKPLTVSDLAAAAHLSPRQFSRSFQADTGQTPAKAIERLRVDAARGLLEDSSHSVDMVARETGFGDRNHMRRAFLRTVGQPPQALRRANKR